LPTRKPASLIYRIKEPKLLISSKRLDAPNLLQLATAWDNLKM